MDGSGAGGLDVEPSAWPSGEHLGPAGGAGQRADAACPEVGRWSTQGHQSKAAGHEADPRSGQGLARVTPLSRGAAQGPPQETWKAEPGLPRRLAGPPGRDREGVTVVRGTTIPAQTPPLAQGGCSSRPARLGRWPCAGHGLPGMGSLCPQRTRLLLPIRCGVPMF